MVQQLELEKRMREYNDYHSKQIQNCQSVSPNSLPQPGSKRTQNSQLIVQKENRSPTISQNNVTRNASFLQNGGKSRLEITSREVKEKNNCISISFSKIIISLKQ